MINIINEKQKVYELYKLLGGGITDYSEVTRLVENSLFHALSIYVGEGATNDPDTQQADTPVLVETLDISLIVFHYKLSDLFDEVYKRTSYIAKSRRDKETKTHLLDLVAMTKDDDSIFQPFLRDASSKVSQALSAFTKQVSGAYLHLVPAGLSDFVPDERYYKGDRIQIAGVVWECTGEAYSATSFDSGSWTELPSYFYTDDKVEFIIKRPDWVNANATPVADTAIFEALVSYVMARWFKIVFPEEYAAYAAEFEAQKATIASSLNSQNRVLNRRHRMF